MLKYAGTVSGIKGFKGSIIVTDLPAFEFEIPTGTSIKVGFSEKFANSYTVNSWKLDKKAAIITLVGINSDKDALELKEKGIFAPSDSFKRKKNNLQYDDEIIGCIVISAKTKRQLGIVKEIWYMPANDVILIETAEGDLPLPVIESVVVEFDLKKRKLQVVLPDGIQELLIKKK